MPQADPCELTIEQQRAILHAADFMSALFRESARNNHGPFTPAEVAELLPQLAAELCSDRVVLAHRLADDPGALEVLRTAWEDAEPMDSRMEDATEFILHVMDRAGMLLTTATDDPEYHVLSDDPRATEEPSVIELGPGIFEAVLASGNVRPVEIDEGEWFKFDGGRGIAPGTC